LLNYEPKRLDQILSKEIDRCNYTFLYAVVYHILKLEYKTNSSHIDKDEMQKEAEEILRSNKFYSPSDLRKLAEQSKTQQEREKLPVMNLRSLLKYMDGL
jgi:hypothetical protein